MRSFWDRVRHSVMFEMVALAIIAVFGSKITGHSLQEIGALGFALSLIAMGWNFVFNLLFDKWYISSRGTAPRSVAIRIVHAILFEAGMIGAGIPVVMWWLQLNFADALLLDIGYATFFLIYGFVYNWIYDVVFPVHAAKAA